MGRNFSIGKALSMTTAAFSRNFSTFIIIALVFQLPSVIYGLLFSVSADEMEMMMRSGALPTGYIVREVVAFLVILIFALIASSAMIYGTVRYLQGRTSTVGETISRGFETVVPVILVSLVAIVAYALVAAGGVLIVTATGLPLLIIFALIPIMYLGIAWWVVIPATVVERPGVLAAFVRSAELTRGRRWAIFGLVILFVIGYIVISMVIGAVLLGIFFGSGGGISDGGGGYVVITTLITLGLQAVVNVFYAVLIGVCYYLLRMDVDGIGIEEIGAVFD